MNDDKPKIVKSHDVNIDKEYMQWLGEVKARYRSAQIKAKVHVCAEQLLFNWQLGRDLVQKKAEERWGSGVVEQVSLDLQAAFPESKGFSVSNLRYMRQWYYFYTSPEALEKLPQLSGELQDIKKQEDIKHQQLVGEIGDTKLSQVGGEIDDPKLQQAVGELSEGVPFPVTFALVPWGHHIEIMAKSKSIDEALFYIQYTINRGWSRSALMNCMKGDLYHTQGGAITNFAAQLPSPQSELAQAITKDTYDFGFLTLEDGYQEDALETELEAQLTRFLLELGTGFAYLGRQKQIVVAGKTRKLDMLFFHIPLNCYVVVELKTVPFQPEFAGKLNFYVSAVDDLIKTPTQNPTIGLLICSNKDETEVQYAFRNLQTPIGVASYDNVQIKQLEAQLPSVEELKKRIRLLEEELAKKNNTP
jgi:predicted nuclease of restriction endonuclease-like (RecB) superfamily